MEAIECGGVRGTRTRSRSRRHSCEGSWPESVLGGQPANIDKVSAAAVGANPEFPESRLISRFGPGGLLDLHGWWLGAIELQEETSLSGLRSLCWMPEAEIADLVEALGEDMLQETTNELVAFDAAGTPA